MIGEGWSSGKAVVDEVENRGADSLTTDTTRSRSRTRTGRGPACDSYVGIPGLRWLKRPALVSVVNCQRISVLKDAVLNDTLRKTRQADLN